MIHNSQETTLNYHPKKILDRAGMFDAIYTDPLVIGLEAACYATSTCDGPAYRIAAAAADLLPTNATNYERGVAAGMAFMLSAGGS